MNSIIKSAIKLDFGFQKLNNTFNKILFIGFVLGTILFLSSCEHTKNVKFENIISNKIPRPKLGLTLKVSKPSDFSNLYNLKSKKVLLITAVKNNSPAEQAGVKQGDFLLSLDEKNVKGMNDTIAIMQTKKPGDVIIIGLLQAGKRINLIAELK